MQEDAKSIEDCELTDITTLNQDKDDQDKQSLVQQDTNYDTISRSRKSLANSQKSRISRIKSGKLGTNILISDEMFDAKSETEKRSK